MEVVSLFLEIRDLHLRGRVGQFGSAVLRGRYAKEKGEVGETGGGVKQVPPSMSVLRREFESDTV